MTPARLPIAVFLLLAGCKQPADERHFMTGASAASGRDVIERVGCGSCHDIPGLRWPKGTVGPPLAGFPDRRLIAGRLPNRPEVLVSFVRNAPALAPGTTMPAMPITAKEARDVAAYLYALDGS